MKPRRIGSIKSGGIMVTWYKILIYSFILCSAISCRHEDGTFIKGRITNLQSPFILASYLSADTLTIDTITTDNKGRFSYRSHIDTLTTFSLYLNNYESTAVVFANKGEKIQVDGDAKLPDLIKVTGNEINDDITSFKTSNVDLLTQRGQLLIHLGKEKESDTVTGNSLTIQDELVQLNLLNHELTLKAEEFIKEHPTQLSSLILINNFFTNSDNPQALERVLDYMQGEVVETQFAQRLRSYSKKINLSAEGAPMPYFMLKDKDEKDVYSHDFQGKYLLLSFVSTAGVESRETVSLLKNAYAKVNKDSVAFVTVYIDSDMYPINYAVNDSIPWVVVPEKKSWGSDIVESLNVQFIPFNMLITPDGIIKVRNLAAQGVVDMIGNRGDN
ncbi:MAG: thioredoxin family protein [Proteiniphilum sp.]|nr:thioredoxin family protein [Proteiniphilum sp.]MDD3075763.1 thioredoxin family protein [Proteiniphilum sp.]MDD3778727.1 thioredoxin family protein [Proteiniphilum sp.]